MQGEKQVNADDIILLQLQGDADSCDLTANSFIIS